MFKNLAVLILFALAVTFMPTSYANLTVPRSGLYAVSSSSPNLRPQVKFQIAVKGSYAEVARVTRLAQVAEKVVNSEEFEKRVKGAWTKYGKAFSYSDDSGSQVYQKMIEGAEYGGAKDYVWNLNYVFETKYPKCFGIGRWKKCTATELGRHEENNKRVVFNSYPWPGRDDCGIVGTIVHEELHAFNYSHPFANTRTRYLSVPYAIGNLAAEICPKFM